MQTVRSYQCTPIFKKKKHFCPRCSCQMEFILIKRVLDRSTREAIEHEVDMILEGGHNHGPTLYIWDELRCMNCGLQMSIPEMKRHERAVRRNKRKNEKDP